MEDDQAIRDLMLYALNAAGFEAKGFGDGGSFCNALKTESPQIVMLDIMLPGEDGIAILKRLRGNGAMSDIPVILASRLYKKIVQPLNERKLDEPLSNDGDDELSPLLRHLSAQQYQIERQSDALLQKQQELKR